MIRRAAVGLLFLLGIGSIAVASWSLAHAGIGWDSHFDTEAALATRSVDPSWSLDRAYAAVPSTSEYYGVFLQQFADVLHLAATGSFERLQADDSATYLYQGTANLILSVVSVTALAAAIGVAFRSVLAAVFAWSLTLATPLWLGMSHVDFKDVPVAAGLTLVSAGVVLSVSAPRRPATAAGMLLAGSGGAIVLSTRAGSLMLLAALATGSAAGTLVLGRRDRASSLAVVMTAGSALLFAIVFTWATNPIARITMPTWLKNSAGVARSYPWEGTIRTAGKDLLSIDLPWWYVPAWAGAQLPVLTLATVVGGLAVLLVTLVRQSGATRNATALPLVPIALQAIVLPFLIVAGGAVLYDGIRHLLFAIPALMAIPAVALALATRDRGEGRRSRLDAVLTAGAVIVVAASLFASIRWAPYAYAFVNPVAGYDTASRSWELDYWGVSAREGVKRLHELGLSSAYVEPTYRVAIPWGVAPSPVRPGPSSGLYVFLRSKRAADFGCLVIFTIERDGHVLGEGARCPAAPAGSP